MKKLVLSLMWIIILLLGCLKPIDIYNTHGNVVIDDIKTNSEWSINLGYYLNVTFTLRNGHVENAMNVWMDLYVEDQLKNVQFDNTIFIADYIRTNEVIKKTVFINYEMDDTFLRADIKIRWDGGYNIYHYQWGIT